MLIILSNLYCNDKLFNYYVLKFNGDIKFLKKKNHQLKYLTTFTCFWWRVIMLRLVIWNIAEKFPRHVEKKLKKKANKIARFQRLLNWVNCEWVGKKLPQMYSVQIMSTRTQSKIVLKFFFGYTVDSWSFTCQLVVHSQCEQPVIFNLKKVAVVELHNSFNRLLKHAPRIWTEKIIIVEVLTKFYIPMKMMIT